MPRSGGLEDQDAEFVEWMLNLHQYIAEAEKWEAQKQQNNPGQGAPLEAGPIAPFIPM